MITSPYSKSSNSSGFDPILQKLYGMICEIILPRAVSGTYRSSFINNLIIKNNFSEPKNHWKLTVSRTIHFKKFPQTVLKIISAQISWKDFFFFFFFFNFFSKTWSFFHDCKTTNFGCQFFPQKVIFILFFKGGYLILKKYWKHALKSFSEKLWKNGDFTL